MAPLALDPKPALNGDKCRPTRGGREDFMTAVPSPGYGAPASEKERRVRSGPKGLGGLTLGFFACPAFPLAALALALVVYLPNFYAGHLGISLTTVGAVFSV